MQMLLEGDLAINEDQAMTALSDEELGEYIEGVGSNKAMYMVSELVQRGGMERMIDRIEAHYMYL